MIDWYQVRYWVNGLALLAVLLLPVLMIFISAMSKMSRRGACVFIIGVVVATGAADKLDMPEDLLGILPPSIFLPCESALSHDEHPPAYTNPVRFTSFEYSAAGMEASVTWDRDWAPGSAFHFLNFYGSYSLTDRLFADAGRFRIRDWGTVTNFSVAIDWPSVFSNAVASGLFPTNATLGAGFLWTYPELDTDGDGLYDADEICVYYTRWDLRDSDGDGISDPDELFDYATDPNDPDTDGDGMLDGWELCCGLDPTDPSDALDDADADGLMNFEEALYWTRADLRDTDGDLVSDYDEIYLYGTNPRIADTDGDGMDDGAEIIAGFDPCFAGEYHGPERPDGFNPDAYCTVGITAAEPMTWIRFEGDGASDLADPSFFIRTNESVDVTLLMGKTYRVLATNEIGVVGVGDPGITVVTNAPGDLTIVRPVTVSVAPRYNLMLLGAGPAESDGAFRMHVSPAVGGTFEWTNTCCTITSRGDSFWFACGGECSCSGCYASGWLVYEGYALPCLGGFCGCPHEDDEPQTEEDDQPRAAGVDLAFSNRAVIFEDAYTNAPGEVVERRSTITTLSCSAHGGPRGARLSLSLVGSEKLDAISGPGLPSSVRFIPPGQKLEFAIEYEGLLPSAAVNDIVASATLIEEETNARFAATNAITAVKIALSAYRNTLLNSCRQRHVFGVAEDVQLLHFPTSVNGVWNVTIADDVVLDSPLYDHGNGFMCSLESGNGVVRYSFSGCSFSSPICVIEPTIEIRNVRANDRFSEEAKLLDPQLMDVDPVVGEAGHLLLFLDEYAAPYYVSFEGLMFIEIPDDSHDCPHDEYGYYHNETLGGPLSHTVQAGAGKWHSTNSQAFFGSDAAGRRIAYQQPWTEGWKSWPIPMGWGFGVDVLGHFDPNPTSQTFTLHTNGTFRIEKFNHWAERAVTGEIIVDGRVQ